MTPPVLNVLISSWISERTVLPTNWTISVGYWSYLVIFIFSAFRYSVFIDNPRYYLKVWKVATLFEILTCHLLSDFHIVWSLELEPLHIKVISCQTLLEDLWTTWSCCLYVFYEYCYHIPSCSLGSIFLSMYIWFYSCLIM